MTSPTAILKLVLNWSKMVIKPSMQLTNAFKPPIKGLWYSAVKTKIIKKQKRKKSNFVKEIAQQSIVFLTFQERTIFQNFYLSILENTFV